MSWHFLCCSRTYRWIVQQLLWARIQTGRNSFLTRLACTLCWFNFEEDQYWCLSNILVNYIATALMVFLILGYMYEDLNNYWFEIYLDLTPARSSQKRGAHQPAVLWWRGDAWKIVGANYLRFATTPLHLGNATLASACMCKITNPYKKEISMNVLTLICKGTRSTRKSIWDPKYVSDRWV